jgi:hypothetical protein
MDTTHQRPSTLKPTPPPPCAHTPRKAAHVAPPRETAATLTPFGAPMHARPLPRLTSLTHVASHPRPELADTLPPSRSCLGFPTVRPLRRSYPWSATTVQSPALVTPHPR